MVSVFTLVSNAHIAAAKGSRRIRREGSYVKSSIKAAVAIVIGLIPALGFAQASEPLTRAQVRAQLVQLEAAGYNPLANCTGNCPESLVRAEAILAKQQASANAAYGPAAHGTVQSGK